MASVTSSRPTIDELTAKLEKLTGEAYRFEFDASSILKAVSTDSNNPRPDWRADLPRFIDRYFEAAVRTLEQHEIETDQLIRREFNEATTKRVVRFELVDKLQVCDDQRLYRKSTLTVFPLYRTESIIMTPFSKMESGSFRPRHATLAVIWTA